MNPAPPFFIHFFDWFEHDIWKEETFDDAFDWEAIGTSLGDRGSVAFYERQFEYIRSLGIENVAWEFFKTTPPQPSAVLALQRAGLGIAPFLDIELSLQLHSGLSRRPELLNAGVIRPDQQTLDFLASLIDEFFQAVPSDLIGRDKNGNAAIFVFGYGFSSGGKPAQWSWFAESLVSTVQKYTGDRVKFYWTTCESHFQEHLFLHHREHFAPFQFVADTPQSQFSHESVSWNLGFDNRYVIRNYGLQRVVRLDPRYIEEAAWLAHAADPSLVFIYGWNEPFEGSIVFPTVRWGDTKAQLVKHYADRLRSETEKRLPSALVIIDDLSEQWSGRGEDWHFRVLRQMLLYRLRLFVPQADLVTSAEVGERTLEPYEVIVDLSVIKPPGLIGLVKSAMGRKRVIIFDPLAPVRADSYALEFFDSVSHFRYDRAATIRGSRSEIIVRDDSIPGPVAPGCEVRLWADLEDGLEIPLVIEKDHTVYVNSYDYNEQLICTAFQLLYNREMNKSILYGEALASQRLEQNPDGSIVRNRLERYSVNQRWPIPSSIEWRRMPQDLPPEEFDFVFGLE